MTSGRWSKRGGVRETALDGGFLDSFGAGSFSGVEVLSLSAFAPGDRLDDLEGLDSLGEVEALRCALRADEFSRKPSSILMAGDASALRSSPSILCVQAGPVVPTVGGEFDLALRLRWQGDGRKGVRADRSMLERSIDVQSQVRCKRKSAGPKTEGKLLRRRSAAAQKRKWEGKRERSRLSRDQRRDGRVRYRTWWSGILDMAGPGFRTSVPATIVCFQSSPMSCMPWLMILIATLVSVCWPWEECGSGWEDLVRAPVTGASPEDHHSSSIHGSLHSLVRFAAGPPSALRPVPAGQRCAVRLPQLV